MTATHRDTGAAGTSKPANSQTDPRGQVPAEAPLAGGDVPEQDGGEDPGAGLEFTREPVASEKKTPDRIGQMPRPGTPTKPTSIKGN